MRQKNTSVADGQINGQTSEWMDGWLNEPYTPKAKLYETISEIY